MDATTRSIGPLRTRDYCNLQTVVVNVNRFLNKAIYVLRSSRRPAPLTTAVMSHGWCQQNASNPELRPADLVAASRTHNFLLIVSLIVKYDRVNHRALYLLNREGEVGRYTTLSSHPRRYNVRPTSEHTLQDRTRAVSCAPYERKYKNFKNLQS
jgi:hypothetical protein